MSAPLEVVYFELGTKELQVVPRGFLYPLNNYEQVARPSTWGLTSVSFQLIDVGGNKNFMCMPLSQKLETTNRHLATLHWGDNIPRELRDNRWFWVGPIDTYEWRDKLFHQRYPARDPSGHFNRSQQVISSNANLQSALTSTPPYADTSDTSLMPPLQTGPSTTFEQHIRDLINSPPLSESSTAPVPYESSTPFEQHIRDLINSRPRSESSTAPVPYGSSTPFQQPGPLMAPFEYKPSTARKQSGSSTAPIKSGSSSAEKDRGPPNTPRTPDSSKTHRLSTPRTAPLNNNLSKAHKQPGSLRTIPELEPLDIVQQANPRDPLTPPFDYEPLPALNQLSLSPPPWNATSPTTQKRFGAATARQQKHDASQAHYQPGSWKHPPQQSGSSTMADQAGSSTAHDPEARPRATPAPSNVYAASGEEESYWDRRSHDGHDHPDKRRGRK